MMKLHIEWYCDDCKLGVVGTTMYKVPQGWTMDKQTGKQLCDRCIKSHLMDTKEIKWVKTGVK